MHAAFDCLLPPGVARITLCVHGWDGVHGSNYTSCVNKPNTKEWLCQRKGQRQLKGSEKCRVGTTAVCPYYGRICISGASSEHGEVCLGR